MTPSAPPAHHPEARIRLALGAAIAIGLCLRLYGIAWGIPNEERIYSYHPDEMLVAGRAAIMAQTGDFNPRFYFYGSLTTYLTYLAGAVASAIGLVNDLGGWYVAGRVVTVLLGTGTVPVVYFIGRSLWDAEGGIVAAWLLAVMPGPVVHSHYATVDVPATFFVALALLWATHILRSASWRFLALAGASAGLATACKYNAVLVLLCAFVADGISGARRPGIAPLARRWAFLLACAVVAFLSACPYVVLDFATFRPYLPALWQHTHRGHGLIFENTGNGFVYHLLKTLPVVESWPLWCAALVGIIGTTARRERRDLVTMAFVLPYFVVIGAAQVRFLRYTLPLTPMLALYAAQAMAPPASGRGRGGLRVWRGVLLAVVLAGALVSSVATVATLGRQDPRDAAAEWLKPYAGSSVGLLKSPSFYTPPLARLDDPKSRASARYRLWVTGWDAAALRKQQPLFFVVSEFESREEQRLKKDEALTFMRALDQDYVLCATFENRPRAFGRLVAPDFPPHDWLYPFPTVKIWRKRSPS